MSTRSQHFIGHARTVAGLTAVSRVSGLVRDAVVSKAFGASPIWSAFVTAFVLPNLFRRLFGEGALAAAFVPTYAKLCESDPGAARRLASLIAGGLLVALGGVVVLLEGVGAVLLLTDTVPEAGRLTLTLAMLMLPFMALVCTSAMLGGVLQTHGRFGPPAGAPILLNICMVGAAAGAHWGLEWSIEDTAIALAISVLVAGVLQVAWHLRAMRDVHEWTRDVRPAIDDARGVLRRMLPVIVGMGALQIGTLIDGLIAGYPVIVGPELPGGAPYPLDGASAGVLFFASRLYQFPLGVFGIAIATAVFPALSRAASDPSAFGHTLRRGLRTSLFVGLPATLGLLIVAPDLTAVIYEGGAFSSEDSARVVGALRWYALAVWSASLTHVLTRGFYAKEDTVTPMRIGVVCVALNIALSVGLMWTPLGERALALGTGVGACVQAGLLMLLATKRLGVDLFDRAFFKGLGRIGLCGALMFGVVLGAGTLLGEPLAGWWTHAARLLGLVAIGGVAYVIIARILRSPELRWLVERDSSGPDRPS